MPPLLAYCIHVLSIQSCCMISLVLSNITPKGRACTYGWVICTNDQILSQSRIHQGSYKRSPCTSFNNLQGSALSDQTSVYVLSSNPKTDHELGFLSVACLCRWPKLSAACICLCHSSRVRYEAHWSLSPKV